VTLVGGIELLNKISAADIKISLDYNEIISDSTGILTPTITIPPYTKLLNITPHFIQHKIIINSPNKKQISI